MLTPSRVEHALAWMLATNLSLLRGYCVYATSCLLTSKSGHEKDVLPCSCDLEVKPHGPLIFNVNDDVSASFCSGAAWLCRHHHYQMAAALTIQWLSCFNHVWN